MKKNWLVVLLLLAGIVGSSPVQAEDNGNHGTAPEHSKRHWKDKADANGDGMVDEAERAAAKASYEEKRKLFKNEMKEKADLNGDGVLDEAEKNQARELMAKKHDNNTGLKKKHSR